MQAQRMMSANPVTAAATQTVGEVLERMCGKGLRLLPVLDAEGKVAGVVKVVPKKLIRAAISCIPAAVRDSQSTTVASGLPP